MRNESNTITGRTCQMSGNTSSRMHSGDVSRNRRIVVRRQKIALVSVAFIALATIICIFLSGAVRTQAAPSEISCKYYTSIEVQSGEILSKGYPPAVREICEAVDLKSTSSVHSHP